MAEIRVPTLPFSNGTEVQAWQAKWCDYCVHDHTVHDDTGSGCDLFALGALMAGEDDYRWPEAWLPEPDDGRFFLPSRMVCAQFTPCHEDDCTGDPGASERAERVIEVTDYWKRHAVDDEGE
jgi:hypothetical protein